MNSYQTRALKLYTLTQEDIVCLWVIIVEALISTSIHRSKPPKQPVKITKNANVFIPRRDMIIPNAMVINGVHLQTTLPMFPKEDIVHGLKVNKLISTPARKFLYYVGVI